MSIELKSTWASLPRTSRGMPLVINCDPKSKNLLYCNGNAVIIRSIEGNGEADIYTEHAVQTTVACYAPSGFYIASGDISGKLRIWDTTQKEHILKNEFQPLSGAIKDIAWSGDSQRMVVVGEGKETFGQVITADSGNTLGNIMGQSKPINAVGFRPDRPYRIATGSEDFSVAFFQGPPFKFVKSICDHTRFVNALRYSRQGDYFVSGSADGRAFVYDGKTADEVTQLGDPAHSGGIYGVYFNDAGNQVVTASGDKSVKTWDVATGQMLSEFKMGTAIEDMQLGCVWAGDTIITASLSGHLNYLDPNNPGSPRKIVKGHNKPITALAISSDGNTMFTAGSEGTILYWNITTGDCDSFQGKGHSNQVQDLCLIGDTLYSCGVDDLLITSDVGAKTYGVTTKLPSQPKALDGNEGGLVVVACYRHVIVTRNGNVVFALDAPYEPSCVSLHSGSVEVAVGGIKDNSVHIFSLNADTLQEGQTLQQNGNISAVEYSPDGAYLAAADGNRRIALYSMPDYTCLISTEWCFHSAKVTCLSWSADSQYLATGALDQLIMVLQPPEKFKNITIPNKKAAHPMSNPTRVKWLNSNTLVSTGQDSHIKTWTVTF